MKKSKLKTSLGAKLALIIGNVVLISLTTVILCVNIFLRKSEGMTAEANNLTLNSRSASAIENELKHVCSSSLQFLDMITVVAQKGDKALLKQTQQIFFQRNSNIAGIVLTVSDKANLKLLNPVMFDNNQLKKSSLDDFLKKQNKALNETCSGKVTVVNSTDLLKQPSIAVMIPWGNNPVQACVIIFTAESLTESISFGVKTVNETFVVNGTGDYLLSSDLKKVTGMENGINNPFISKMMEGSDSASQIEFTGEDGKQYFGAYKKLSDFNIGVYTVAESNLVYESINEITRHNIYLVILILAITILVVLLYTHFGISKPLKILKGSVNEINKGHFNNDYLELMNVKRNDEIGVLNSSVKDEIEFLNIFARFTNKNVAKAIATKSIDFKPHLKDVTVFFSDIRGFTAISDGYKKLYGEESASKIIGFLNDYMRRMVQCVFLSHGTIDKFEGDAIMAVWGILRNDDLSFEKLPECTEKVRKQAEHQIHVCTDAVNCITGSIAMRYALMMYNKQVKYFNMKMQKEGKPDYKPEIKIGCGINSGRASVGLMGSEEKMEYTSIGDAVNFASRTEASNKACGTDILISEDTYNLLKKDYIRCEENNFEISPDNISKEIVVERIPVAFEVKGKGEQHFYGVVNMPGFDFEEFFKRGNPDFVVDKDCAKACGKNGPATMNEVRTLLGIPVPDFRKVNLNAEESKIQQKKN